MLLWDNSNLKLYIYSLIYVLSENINRVQHGIKENLIRKLQQSRMSEWSLDLGAVFIILVIVVKLRQSTHACW